MTKGQRLELIREIVGKPVPGMIPVTQPEVEQIAKEEFALRRDNMEAEDENVIDMNVISGKV